MKRFMFAIAGAILFATPLGLLAADKKDKKTDDAAAIRAAIDTYVAAYNRGDAKAVADCWSQQGQWISPTGEKIHGRAAIQKALEAVFAEGKGMHLEVLDSTVRLVSPEVALEEGTARVVRPGEAPTTSTYLAVHVKQDGRWKLDSVRETELPSPPSQYEQLKDLEWLIGEWIDKGADSTIATKVVWTKNKNFILYSFKVSVPGMDDLEGTQVIGWDPIEKTIRSWIFDSDGAYGEGIWTKKGNHWLVKTSLVLPDGGRASSVNIYRSVDDNTYTWKSIGRQVEGKHLPSIEEVKVVRKPGTQPNKPAAKPHESEDHGSK